MPLQRQGDPRNSDDGSRCGGPPPPCFNICSPAKFYLHTQMEAAAPTLWARAWAMAWAQAWVCSALPHAWPAPAWLWLLSPTPWRWRTRAPWCCPLPGSRPCAYVRTWLIPPRQRCHLSSIVAIVGRGHLWWGRGSTRRGYLRARSLDARVVCDPRQTVAGAAADGGSSPCPRRGTHHRRQRCNRSSRHRINCVGRRRGR